MCDRRVTKPGPPAITPGGGLTVQVLWELQRSSPSQRPRTPGSWQDCIPLSPNAHYHLTTSYLPWEEQEKSQPFISVHAGHMKPDSQLVPLSSCVSWAEKQQNSYSHSLVYSYPLDALFIFTTFIIFWKTIFIFVSLFLSARIYGWWSLACFFNTVVA